MIPAESSVAPERAKSAEAYASFIPHGLYRRLGEVSAAGGDDEPISLRLVGLCLDIAGFTVVADRLERGRGEDGIEDVIEHLNRCFGAAIAEATKFGGEVASLTGDGLVILWPRAGPGAAREPVAELVAACRCALGIRDRTQTDGNAGENPFAVKMSIGVGDVFIGHLRSDERSGQLLIAGSLISELATTCAQATHGQILLTAEAQSVSPAACYWQELPGRGFALEAVRGDWPAFAKAGEAAAPFEHPGFVPPTMPALIDRAQLDWLAERRVATVMFVGFDGLSCADAASVDLVRRAASRLDALVRAYSGLQEKVQVDEKGPFSLITFGLPPRVGSYHPDQALAAAVAARRLLKELGVSARIGVATGKIFRCAVGTETRRDYTIYGSTVLRAVRIMAHAVDRILCDAETRAASLRGHRFTGLEPLALKGMGSPVAVFELLVEEDRPALPPATQRVVGRHIEISRLRQKLLELKAGRPTITAVAGAAGIGKSSVLRAAMHEAAALGIEVLCGSGAPLTVGAPYQAWREVFLTLAGIHAEGPLPTQRARLLDFLAEDSATLALAPLLDAVAPVGIPENDLTRAMGERARAIARRELLARLIARQAQGAPTLLVFDDAHWLDDMSMKLLVELWLEATGASVLVATRREEEGGTVLSHLAGLHGFELLSIEGLAASEVETLLATTLDTEHVADDCVQWIHRATSGHPLFTTELAKVLRERGVIICDGAVARFAIERHELDALSLPSGVEALVTDRLDRLGPVEQLTFKTASAIGIEFSFSLLEQVYPHAGSRAELNNAVDRLIGAGLIIRNEAKESEAGEHLAFAHATFRQAGYHQLPRAQRRTLHLAIAQVLEPAAAADPRRSYALLAFHYRCAARYDEALRYLDLASELARHEGAFGVAAELSQQALDIHGLPEAAAVRDGLRPRDWRVRLARCQTWLGDLDGARQLGDEVLAELGYSFPGSERVALLKSVAAILRQLGRQLRPPAAPSPDRLRELDAAALAATVVSVVYHYRGLANQLMLAALLTADFGSESGERVLATDAYGMLSVLAGLMRLPRVRRHLLRRYEGNAARCGTGDDRRFYFMYASMHHVAFCEWERVEENMRRRVEVAAGFIDPYFGNIELTLDALTHYYRGQFEETRVAFEELHRRAGRQRSLQHLAWANYGIAEALLPLGRLQDAIPLLLTAEEMLETQHDNHSRLICQGLLAVAYLRYGDSDRALDVATRLGALVPKTQPNNLTSLEGYAGAVEVWLGLAHEQADRLRQHHRAAARMLRIFARYAMLFPVGRPRLWLYRGYLHWQRGSPRRARRCWRRALHWAERNRMPYEIARAATALATHGSPSAPMAAHWRALAENAFRETGASPELSPMERAIHGGGRG